MLHVYLRGRDVLRHSAMSAQDDANQAAKEFACNSAAQLALLANPDATELVIDGVLGPPVVPPYVSPPGTKIFYNGPQTCSVTCPDSSLFTFTCPPGRFIGANQAQADARAKSYACQQAFLRRVCPPSHPCSITDATPLPAFDQGQPYSHQFTASGGVPPFAWSITAGTLPTGLSMNANGLISGTASLVNGNLDQTFTVRATDFSTPPNSCTKEFTLPVVDYNNYPTGKKWRIKGYADGMFTGLFGCTTCGAPPAPTVWNGQFDLQIAPGSFKTVTTHPTLDGGRGIIPNLVSGLNSPPWPAGWFLVIDCSNSVGDGIWLGNKTGSNAGAKLDSAAGIYTRQSGLIGQNPICGTNATIEVEEY